MINWLISSFICSAGVSWILLAIEITRGRTCLIFCVLGVLVIILGVMAGKKYEVIEEEK